VQRVQIEGRLVRGLLALLIVGWLSTPAAAQTWSSIDYDSTPADNSGNALTTCTINTTDITNESDGDLMVLVAFARSTSSSLSVTTAGGVTWTAYAGATHTVTTTLSIRVFWSLVDADGLTGNLVVTDAGSGVLTVGCGVAVFRASTGTVAQDVALALDNDDAAASPVTVAAATTNVANTLAIAIWASSDDNTWNSLTAGWSNPTNMTGQTRNNDATDSSLSMAYTTVVSAGSTGTVSNTQATVGPDTTIHGMVVFKSTGGGGGVGGGCILGGGIICEEWPW
jgi:hypothetical protein